MDTYDMILAEYLRFLDSLNKNNTSVGVKKIANLVHTNLNEIDSLSSQQGQRVKSVVKILQDNWNTTSAELQTAIKPTQEQSIRVRKLTNMLIGPFRGFSHQEEFDLSSRFVFIYGTNGTGKSSFCEALEYGLLGNVAEAENKRFPEQQEYLKNAYSNQFVEPIIKAENEQGNEISITPNEAYYRFCFVEKNRIDSFSRIAAQTPAKQKALISTLFGLESFTEFVRNFTAEISGNHIDLVGKNKTKLEKKRQEIFGEEKKINEEKNTLENLTKEEQLIANKYREGISFDEMVIELCGNEKLPSMIQQLESELQQEFSTKSDLTIATLNDLHQKITKKVDDLNSKNSELTTASQQVSFKALYEAVSKVQNNSPDKCPACNTSLNNVVVNPFTHAELELKNLSKLSLVQNDIESLNQDISSLLLNLSQIINKCSECSSQNNLPYTRSLNGTNKFDISWWESLHNSQPDSLNGWQKLLSQVEQLEIIDHNIEQKEKDKKTKQEELEKYRKYEKDVTILKTQKQSANERVISAQKSVNDFEAKNAQLISDVETEKIKVNINKAIASAYKSFVIELNKYWNSLPALLVANLGDKVVDFYNRFNRNDSTNELLAKVKLPLAQNQRLKVSFQTDSEKFYDALHILSEGHIRCLGLAILLAKNINDKAPLLIFDDPVNAIDDDHRESIRKTLFEDNLFSGKQILLTCHGEEFFKDILNLLSANTASQAKQFTFLPRQDETHIQIDFKSAPRNYILAAREHLNRNEIRDALAKSRQALESLTKGKIWKYVGRYGDGNLSLKLHSHNAPIGLRNLSEQLKSKVGKNSFSDKNKLSIFNPLSELLGLNGDSKEWCYLNKGTHEESDRPEFDRAVVKNIIINLEALDNALVTMKR